MGDSNEVLALWNGYRAEMRRAFPTWGGRLAVYYRRELEQGRLSSEIFRGGGADAVGFALYREERGLGTVVEACYLRATARSPQELRRHLQRFLRAHPTVFQFPDVMGAIAVRRQIRAFDGLGYRHVERRWLRADPRKMPGVPPTVEGVRTRRLRKSDRRGLTSLAVRAYDHHIDAAFGAHADAKRWAPGYYRDLFRDPRSEIDFRASFVARVKGRPVGEVLVCGRKHPYVHHLNVDPDYQRRGVGTALLLRSVDVLRRHGVRKVLIGVSPSNPTGAFEFYRSRGFQVVPGTAGRMPGMWIHETTRIRRGLRMRELRPAKTL